VMYGVVRDGMMSRRGIMRTFYEIADFRLSIAD
jgi:hypothetical protein